MKNLISSLIIGLALIAGISTVQAQTVAAKQPVVAVSTYGNYAWVNPTQSAWGYSIVPSLQVAKNVALQADITQQYLHPTRPGQTDLSLTVGPKVNVFARGSVTPFVFAEGGEVRSNYKVVDWNPTLNTGLGFDFAVSPRVAISVIPAEYVGTHLDNGTWNHSYTTKFGFKFNIF